MILGIDHGYYAVKTRNCSFPIVISTPLTESTNLVIIGFNPVGGHRKCVSIYLSNLYT